MSDVETMGYEHVGDRKEFIEKKEFTGPDNQAVCFRCPFYCRECAINRRFDTLVLKQPSSNIPTTNLRKRTSSPIAELQSEICDDFCQGRAKYPSAYVSFQGSWLKDGNSVIETLKGANGKDGPVGT